MEEQAPVFFSPTLNEGYRMDMMRKVDELVELVAFHRFRDRMVKWIEMVQQTWIQPSKICMFLMTLMTNVTPKKNLVDFIIPGGGDGPSLRSRGGRWHPSGHLF